MVRAGRSSARQAAADGYSRLKLADEGPEARLGLWGARRGVERRPVGGPDPLVEAGPLGQLGQHISEPMDSASLAIGVGPQIADRADQAGGAIGHHKKRAPQATAEEAPPQVEPVVCPLALAEADVEQDPAAVDGEAPGDEHALLGPVGPDRQVDRVTEQGEQADLGQAPRPKGPVAIAQFTADRAHGGLADGAQAGLSGEAQRCRGRRGPERRRR
jgi:hypothetical protein